MFDDGGHIKARKNFKLSQLIFWDSNELDIFFYSDNCAFADLKPFQKIIYVLYEEMEDCATDEDRAGVMDYSGFELISLTDQDTYANGTIRFLRNVVSPVPMRVFAEKFKASLKNQGWIEIQEHGWTISVYSRIIFHYWWKSQERLYQIARWCYGRIVWCKSEMFLWLIFE